MRPVVDWHDLDMTELTGKIFTKVSRETYDFGDSILFKGEQGDYIMYHSQDCCENVSIEEIIGDLNDLIGTPIIEARRDTNSDTPPPQSEYTPDSYTWTFFNFRTIKGSVTVRWFGESNGYYSESADLYKITEWKAA